MLVIGIFRIFIAYRQLSAADNSSKEFQAIYDTVGFAYCFLVQVGFSVIPLYCTNVDLDSFSSILQLRSGGLPAGHGEAGEVRVLPPAGSFDLPEFLPGYAPLSTLRYLLPQERHLS